MGRTIFGTTDAASDYAAKRLQTNRDDRCDRQKMWDDAKLRGTMGVNQANRLIAAIDDLKSRRN